MDKKTLEEVVEFVKQPDIKSAFETADFDYIYDYNFFTQQLETFSCLSFLSNGNTILPPCKLNLFPYFRSY